ncbi:hypothetical protein V494_08016 [Pseudogymnoascus sp. VKM F-4513 (FW-928)]|nr:hypothetical protein V494_08016 [Pseudogymnoascus sp. VKM F-4513 (FW-928)]
MIAEIGKKVLLPGHARSRGESSASNRSSVDEGSVGGTEDETTVVEPEQGNGEFDAPVLFLGEEGEKGLTEGWCSSLAYYFAVEARSGFESGGAADVYFGTEEHAGEDYELHGAPGDAAADG